jgi:hypothetical protein
MRNPFKGFLAKGNRRATRRSVLITAAVGTVLMPAAFYALSIPEPQFRKPWVWIFGAILGAISFAAIEWQEPY